MTAGKPKDGRHSANRPNTGEKEELLVRPGRFTDGLEFTGLPIGNI